MPPSSPPRRRRREIRRVLVANRGEIARRVIRTARALGLQTVAMHSQPDSGEPFVRDADFAVAVGGRTAAESYLDVDLVVEAARRAGADAVHPGYGFLSEEADLAEAVERAGKVWIGPPPDAMRAMARKVQAKRLVGAVGVPLVPGAEVPDDAPEETVMALGDEVRWPLLVKASAGGGGRGMRLVTARADLLDAVRAARAEAGAAFGDSTVFLERYLTRGRHVEVQVFADQVGSVVHLFERECSIQRRHQKLIEESPAPGASTRTLNCMYDAALAAARAIGYVGAGTVEFLVTGEGEEQEFFFLEMNTRLQVEHPVTEEITGLDLVEWQIRIAQGEALPRQQAAITRTGHAIEARIYAEDPANDHRPGTGTVELFEVTAGPGIRVEAGVVTGSQVSTHYDAMLAKVVAVGPTRDVAVDRLAAALATAQVAGVPTNRDALVAILRSPEFRVGDITTAFLDEHPRITDPPCDPRLWSLHLAAATLGLVALDTAVQPWAGLAPPGWRNLSATPHVRRFGHAVPGVASVVEVRYEHRRGGRVDLEFVIDDGDPGPDPVATSAGRTSDLPARVVVERCVWESERLLVEVAGVGAWCTVRRAGGWVVVAGAGASSAFEVLPRFSPSGDAAVEHGLTTPVPGTVAAVLVEVGDLVDEGETLVLLEAMKMEHRIRADSAGVVGRITVSVGEQVDAHEVVAVIEAGEDG